MMATNISGYYQQPSKDSLNRCLLAIEHYVRNSCGYYLRRYRVPPHLKDDVVQDTMIKLLRYLNHSSLINRMQFIDGHRSLIGKILRTVAESYQEKNFHAELRGNELLCYPPEISRDDVKKWLLAFDPDQRQVVELSIFHRFRNKEISKMMDISPSRVSRILARGRKYLQQMLTINN